MTDRTPVILTILVDLLTVRAAEKPDDHDLHALADGVALAVDHGASALSWPPSKDDKLVAEMLLWAVAGPPSSPFDNRDATAYRERIVARRLADVAASLLVRGNGLRRESEALWIAASRILGLHDRHDGEWRCSYRELEDGVVAALINLGLDEFIRSGDICRIRDGWVAAVGRITRCGADSIEADLASMTEQRDEALRQLADMRRELREKIGVSA